MTQIYGDRSVAAAEVPKPWTRGRARRPPRKRLRGEVMGSFRAAGRSRGVWGFILERWEAAADAPSGAWCSPTVSSFQ